MLNHAESREPAGNVCHQVRRAYIRGEDALIEVRSREPRLNVWPICRSRLMDGEHEMRFPEMPGELRIGSLAQRMKSIRVSSFVVHGKTEFEDCALTRPIAEGLNPASMQLDQTLHDR